MDLEAHRAGVHRQHIDRKRRALIDALEHSVESVARSGDGQDEVERAAQDTPPGAFERRCLRHRRSRDGRRSGRKRQRCRLRGWHARPAARRHPEPQGHRPHREVVPIAAHYEAFFTMSRTRSDVRPAALPISLRTSASFLSIPLLACATSAAK